MGHTPAGQHHYNLIASAVAGRTISVHWHNNPRLPAYTDNRGVFLPATGRRQDQVMEVISQALLIRSGSLRRQQLQHLVGRSRIAQRYVQAELARGAALYNDILPRRFCDHPAIRNFPNRSVDAEGSLQLALGDQQFPEAPPFLGKLRAVLILSTNLPDTAFATLTRKQQRGGMEKAELPELDEADQDDAEESKILRMFQNPLLSGGAIADLLNRILGAGPSGRPEDDSSSNGGAEMKIGHISQSKKKGAFATLTELAMDIVASDQATDAGTRAYPEWDFTSRSYRENWALVDEMDPWREEPENDRVLHRLLVPPSSALKRKLTGIGLSFETHHGQYTGEDIALDRLVDYMRDLRMGNQPAENIYSHSMRTRRDLAAMVLLDVSGSTGEKDETGLSVHHRQMQLAYHLTRALHELGDQVSCYAFHSWGKSLVRLLRIKSFVEKHIDTGMLNRLAMLEPVGYTRTGAALRHAAYKLQEETGMPYRVLIVITDGFSYDQDYEGRYGEEDTRKALQEVRAAGVGCLCLTIGSSQEEKKLAEIYGAASTLSIRDYEQFMGHLRPAMLKAVGQIRR